MSVKISNISPNSICDKKKLHSGDILISINGNEINDVLDYRFYAADEKLKIEYLNSKNRKKHICIKNCSSCDELGMEFETYLMDEHKSCKNHCIFCFIDQLPKGMRKSLYFKDDDSRLSFFFGNYITLTNLSEHEVERIIKMHINPLNVSVHTTNPELRVRMMKNPNAGESLKLLKRFSDAGISINAQLVLCPGINDGEELLKSLNDLGNLDTVNSVAAVPVGLTKYRDGLYPLKAYTENEAAAVIDLIDGFNRDFEQKNGRRLAFPSDEFFQIAKRQIPPEEYYCGYPQLDNGVGLCRLTENEFEFSLNSAESDEKSRKFAVVTGHAAFSLMKKLSDDFCEKYKNTEIKVYEIENRFFGEKVTVAGLVTGKDLIEQLKEREFDADILLVPSVMLKSETEPVFLDDTGVADVEKQLNTSVVITCGGGKELFDLYRSL